MFAFDPATANQHANRDIRELTISLPGSLDHSDRNEPFLGPRGEYLEVIDYDPASGCFYQPIDLNDREIDTLDGLTPSEDNPQFHQQMVYAVAMQTIATFENVLGRVALWSPRTVRNKDGKIEDTQFVRRLRVYPHALREANAYYDPAKKALLFGYFTAGRDVKGLVPNQTIFTCLSQDIVVHETCHALLDGLHPRFVEPSNPDMLALHEAFADIVAIFQHFSFPEVLRSQIAKTRGDLEKQNMLGALAQEFGRALGRGGALRDVIGYFDHNEVWQTVEPDPQKLRDATEVHDRGAILVAAVFRAFLTIYKERVADLLRIASNGTGILPSGEIDPDLVNRLAKEASKSARHILRLCIRALDYLPPVDATFGDYLRAIITADHDLFPDDDHGYRSAVIEAFTAWGIVPEDMPVVTEAQLLWPSLSDVVEDDPLQRRTLDADLIATQIKTLLFNPMVIFGRIKQGLETSTNAYEGKPKWKDHEDDYGDKLRNDEQIIRELLEAKEPERVVGDIVSRNLLDLGLSADRKIEFHVRQFYQRLFWGLITFTENEKGGPAAAELLDHLGIIFHVDDDKNPESNAPCTLGRSKVNRRPRFEVHNVRMAKRPGMRGELEPEYVVELVQARVGFLDETEQARADAGEWISDHQGKFVYRCGCTVLIDAVTHQVRRVIRSRCRVDDEDGLRRRRTFELDRRNSGRTAFSPSAVGSYGFAEDGSTFAILHRHAETGSAE